MSELEGVRTQLAVMQNSLDVVIKHHGKTLDQHDVTIGSAHSKIGVLELQSNTHEVQIADLVYKSRGAFGNFWIVLSGMTALVALLIGVFT